VFNIDLISLVFMSYSIIAPFKSAEKAALTALYAAMGQRFRTEASVKVTLETDPSISERHVQVSWDDWSLRVYSEFEPHVLLESREIAELYGAGRSDQSEIASCANRVTIDSDDDPGMDHYNDYVFVLEVLEQLGAIALFDPVAETFV
jgi:hypothetical protein